MGSLIIFMLMTVIFMCRLKKKDALSLKSILVCPNDINVWMALNSLIFNKKKTVVMVFGPNSSCDPHPAYLGPLAVCKVDNF